MPETSITKTISAPKQLLANRDRSITISHLHLVPYTSPYLSTTNAKRLHISQEERQEYTYFANIVITLIKLHLQPLNSRAVKTAFFLSVLLPKSSSAYRQHLTGVSTQHAPNDIKKLRNNINRLMLSMYIPSDQKLFHYVLKLTSIHPQSTSGYL